MVGCNRFNFTYYGEQQNSGVRTQHDQSKLKHVGTTALFRGSGDHKACAQRCRDLLQCVHAPTHFRSDATNSLAFCVISFFVSVCL